MSILNTQVETPARKNARAIELNIDSVKQFIFGVARDSINRLDQDTLNEFGTDAHKLFVELEALLTYATQRLTANNDLKGLQELSALASLLPAFTVNEEGSVTLIIPEPEEPEEIVEP